MRDIFEDIEGFDDLFSSPGLAGEEELGEVAEPTRTPRPEPIGFVTRELKRPDGSIIQVEVPVYAAFESTAELPDHDPADAGEATSGDEPQHEDLSDLIAAEDAD